jgi:8-oxo-dGTP diphosphatase
MDKDNHLLAIRRRDHLRWEPPGGLLEPEEHLDESVRRTVWSETGLLVRPVILTGVYKDMRRNMVTLVFRCTVVGGGLNGSTEAGEAKWLTAAEVRSHMSEAGALQMLDALRLGPPRILSHDDAGVIGDTSPLG